MVDCPRRHSTFEVAGTLISDLGNNPTHRRGPRRLVILAVVGVLLLAAGWLTIRAATNTCEEWNAKVDDLYSPPFEDPDKWTRRLGELIRSRPKGCRRID